MKPLRYLLPLVATSCLLSACVPVLLAGATTTASVVHDRRTAGSIVDDNALEVKINAIIAKNSPLADQSHVNVTGYNGNILLTGEAASEQVRQAIGNIASAEPNVKNVYNRIIIGRASTLLERTYDAKQTAKVKAAMFDVDIPGFDPTRVKVVTEHGTTYLLGLVTPQEGQEAARIASRVSGVREVVTLFEAPTAL